MKRIIKLNRNQGKTKIKTNTRRNKMMIRNNIVKISKTNSISKNINNKEAPSFGQYYKYSQ